MPVPAGAAKMRAPVANVNRMQRRCMGALTSKPYAFTARPWELRRTPTIDVTDALGANIEIHTKVGEVMRVVPRENDEVNEEWIHDKARFAYDGLKRQRLMRPLVRIQSDTNWDWLPSSWRGAFAQIRTALFKCKEKNGSLRAIVGPTADLYSAMALSDFANMTADAELESLGSTGGLLGADICSSFRFNSTLLGLEQADYVLIVGTDLANEAPLLNMRLRQMFLGDDAQMEVIGNPSNLSFPIAALGATPKALEALASGDHPSAETLANAKRPAIIVSSSALERHDGGAIQAALERIARKTPALRQPASEEAPQWNGMNVLHHAANDVGLLELGRAKPFDANAGAPDVLFLLNVSEEELPVKPSSIIGPNTFVVMQHSHGDGLTSRTDVVLPGAAFSEKNGLYINTESRAQLARNATSPPSDARVDWAIFRALSEAVGGPILPYQSENELRQRIATLAPSVELRGKAAPSMLPAELLGEGYAQIIEQRAKETSEPLDRTPFKPTLHDFWLEGHAMARASALMARASVENAPSDNFLNFNEG